jgi:tellurite resistance protein TerC
MLSLLEAFMAGLDSIGSPLAWAGFCGLLIGLLALDLGVFHRRPRPVTTRESALWSAFWVGLAVAFGFFLLARFGEERALEFATGYLIEKALAVDNLFVFVVVFGAFALPREQQHRVLFWGVFGALLMRAVLVITGGIVLARFHWAVYAFGGALAIFGLKLMFSRGEAKDGFAVRLSRRLLPMAEGTHVTFTVRQGGRLLATPMLAALFAAEAADLAFAVESIPAVYAITSDPFIVFSSNALALLGMRSLYFLLAQWLERFTSLKPALALILIFVGMKMLFGRALPISPLASVTVIAALLAGAISVDVLRRFWKRAAA